MTPELQQAIEECRKRGIVPGVKISCAANHTPVTGTVSPFDKWEEWNNHFGRHLKVGTDNNGDALYAVFEGNWTNTITPAPAPQEEEGLKEGDACEPDENMRKAIVDRAKASGLKTLDGYHAPYPLTWYMGRLCYTSGGPRCETISRLISVGEFYDRLCVTAKKPKLMSIAGHKVLATKGTVEIDDTVYANSTIRAIAEKLID